MNAAQSSESTFEEILQRYLVGFYETADDDVELRDGTELFNKMQHSRQLLPMLSSEYESCVLQAVYIASEAIDGCEVFPAIVPLLKSKWGSVRSVVCDCFRYCAHEPEHIISILPHLEDHARPVRLGVMGVLRDIDGSLLLALRACSEPGEKWSKAVATLSNQQPIDLSTAANAMRVVSKPEKMCLYISLLRHFGKSDALTRFALESGDADVLDFDEMTNLSKFTTNPL